MNLFDRIVLCVFSRSMIKYVNRVLSIAYETSNIYSKELHFLSAYFDKTQKPIFNNKTPSKMYDDMHKNNHW